MKKNPLVTSKNYKLSLEANSICFTMKTSFWLANYFFYLKLYEIQLYRLICIRGKYVHLMKSDAVFYLPGFIEKAETACAARTDSRNHLATFVALLYQF
jgi:hypothetical protein